MKYFVVEPFNLETQYGTATLQAGQSLELAADQVARLGGKVCLADALHLWRWFTLGADRIYRSSPKAADAWERHKEHKRAAAGFCRAGNMPAAVVELRAALKALRGAAITQPDLVSA